MTEICFPAEQWAALSGLGHGPVPATDSWDAALMTTVRSYAAAAAAALD